MKQKLFAALAAMCAVLLAGCSSGTAASSSADSAVSTAESSAAEESTEAGPETAGADYADVTLQQVMDANNLSEIVAKHGKVAVVTSVSSDDEQTAETDFSFTANEGGELQMHGRTTSYLDNEENQSITTLVSTDTTPAAVYYSSNDYTGMTVLASGNAASTAENFAYTYPSTTETTAENSLQDGALLLTVHEEFEGDAYSEYVYYVDPESLELYAVFYTYKSEAYNGQTVTNYYYGNDADTYTVTENASAQILTDDNACAVTVVFNPGEADEETQTFQIVKGTSLSVEGETFSDAACSQGLYDFDTTADSLTVYARI